METLYDQLPPPSPKTGIRRGIRSCEKCGSPFTPAADTIRHGGGRFCSPSCAASVPRPNAPHTVPESTKAERIRANGLVNKRRKLCWFAVPTLCMKCGAHKRLDSHHPDYSRPAEVLWLCRSCHRKAHVDPSTVAGLSIFDTSIRTTPAAVAASVLPPRRGKGLPAPEQARRICRPHIIDNGVTLFLCRACGDYLPGSAFYRLCNPASACGLTSECRRCSTVRRTTMKRVAARLAAAGEGGTDL